MARSAGAGKTALVAAALIGSMMGTVTSAGAADAPKADVAKPTAAEYVAWLDSQNTAEADQTATQFKELSAENQQKFLNYISDPEIAKALAGQKGDPNADPDFESKRTATGERTSTTLAGGDVVVSSESGVTPPASRGSAGDWSCYYWVNNTVLGIEITKHTLTQTYHSTSTEVDKVYSARASHKNLNPGVQVDNQPEDQWISAAGNALAYVTWNVDFVYSGSQIHMDKLQHVRCDETGFREGYIKDA
ncbi:hypothetical protein G5C51_13960 [Streptomyces sp. A7024]|uniref:Secreted protein n=1 Tax=Streptomyces coryli TaxID=1128680 RepID=A0A6G4TZV9_9ACTN|nr:hypothetical protein [Streptomyces coryli]NGN64996.1 hypothetical protein [Streptomyces coryli]